METPVQKIQRRRLQWQGHVKQMDDSRLPAETIDNISIQYKKPGKTEEKMYRQCQRGSVSKRKQCTTGMGMCKRQKKMDEVCPCSPIISNLLVKVDGSNKKKNVRKRLNTVERFNLRQIEMETGQHVRKRVRNLLETAEDCRSAAGYV